MIRVSILVLICSDRKFYVVDGQNASLAGGVAMGAIANFMVQPYAAIIIGSIAGLISCWGYRVLQVNVNLTFLRYKLASNNVAHIYHVKYYNQ